MKQKLLILLLECIASISVSAYDFSADNDGTTIYYNYIESDDTSVCVTNNSDNIYSGDVIIPATVSDGANTYYVTAIDNWAFSGCCDLTSVTIPNSVTSIGYSAFGNCSGLISLTIPDSVTEIGNWAFSSCTGLTSVTIGNSVISMGVGVFANCVSLQIFNGEYASSDNRCLIMDGTLNSFAPAGLTSYEIPTSVTEIGGYAFFGCSGLTEVTIPNSVTSIGDLAFEDCSGLTSVIIPESVTEICYGAFQFCSGLTSVTIPESVTEIAAYAFYGCSGLIEVTIHSSVIGIGYGAFANCVSLQTFNSEYASSDKRCLIMDDGTLNSFAPAGLTSYEIPESVTSINYYAFYGSSNLIEVTIPNSVTEICGCAFENCSGLTSLAIENDNPANISLYGYVFGGVPTSTCILYVPKGSKELYAVADQWKDFVNIEEFIATGVEDFLMDNEFDPEAPYYDMMGRRVVNPTNGIYIRNGKKVLVK